MKHISSLLLGVVLLLAPAAVVLEKADGQLWQERLLRWGLEEEPNRHTPVHTQGTFLRPQINEDTTLTRRDNPVIITGTTLVPAGVRLTIEEGTRVYIHEFGELVIAGQLTATGSADQPVIFSSNEAHQQNRTWNGIRIEQDGQANVSHAIIRYGSPAIACLPGSNALLKNIEVYFSSLGLFTQSAACALQDSRLLHVYDGVVGVGLEPRVTNTTISAEHEEIRYIENPKHETRNPK